MTNIPIPQGQFTQEMDDKLAQDLGAKMARHCFDGDFEDFHATFAEYLASHSGNDPFGRRLLNGRIQGAGMLWFRSTSTDAQELREQSALRWAAWMSVMPLDMQLHMVVIEATPRFDLPIDPNAFEWDQ